MNINKYTSFLFFLFLSSGLFAHGPSRQKVIEKVEINHSPSVVWNLISKFDKYNWHPDIKDSTANGNTVGSQRTLTFNNGKVVKQSLEKFNNEKMSLTIRILETDLDVLPVNSYSSMLRVIEDENNPGKAILTYRAAFYRGFMGNDPPEHLNDENSKLKVKQFVKKSISGIQNNLK